MEKINIAELLKNCPSGMELDCTMFDNLHLDKVEQDCRYPIGCYTIYDGYRTSVNFTEFGEYSNLGTSKCVIFPKGKTTWEGFVPPCPFKCGDILYTCSDDADSEPYEYIFIFESITENTHVNSYLHIKENDLRIYKAWLTNCDDKYLRFATEEEKQKLFDAIKENGYKWNEETKTLEKLYRFKVGDRVKSKINKYGYMIGEIRKDAYIMYYENDKFGYYVPFSDEDKFDLILNKFDITTLKPFDKVLARDSYRQGWAADFFSHNIIESFGGYAFACIGHCWHQCIPYEGNEHLLGTTNDRDEFYKTWE